MKELEQNVFAKLGNVPNRSMWLDIGDAVYQLEKHAEFSSDNASWLRLVVDRLSTTGSQIGMSNAYKIVRTYKILKKIAEEESEFEPDLYNGCPIGAIEIATRIYKFDLDACKNALRAIRNGASAADISKMYDGVKEKFQTKKDARNHAFGKNQEAVKKVIKAFQQNTHRYIPVAATSIRIFRIRTKQKSTGVGVSFYARWLDENNVERVSGFDALTIDRHSSSWYLNRSRVVFNATFFSYLWIIISSSSENIELIKGDLRVLGVDNVGIINLEDDMDPEVVLSPEGEPHPDRRHLL